MLLMRSSTDHSELFIGPIGELIEPNLEACIGGVRLDVSQMAPENVEPQIVFFLRIVIFSVFRHEFCVSNLVT